MLGENALSFGVSLIPPDVSSDLLCSLFRTTKGAHDRQKDGLGAGRKCNR